MTAQTHTEGTHTQNTQPGKPLISGEVNLPRYLWIETVAGTISSVRGLNDIKPETIREMEAQASELAYEQLEEAEAYWFASGNGGDGENSLQIFDTSTQTAAKF